MEITQQSKAIEDLLDIETSHKQNNQWSFLQDQYRCPYKAKIATQCSIEHKPKNNRKTNKGASQKVKTEIYDGEIKKKKSRIQRSKYQCRKIIGMIENIEEQKTNHNKSKQTTRRIKTNENILKIKKCPTNNSNNSNVLSNNSLYFNKTIDTHKVLTPSNTKRDPPIHQLTPEMINNIIKNKIMQKMRLMKKSKDVQRFQNNKHRVLQSHNNSRLPSQNNSRENSLGKGQMIFSKRNSRVTLQNLLF